MTRFYRSLLAACALVVVAGCASAPSRFYTLASTEKGDGAAATNLAVVVGPVSIPASVDRPEFVVTTAPNRVDVEEFDRWAEPLDEGIARAVSGNLRTLLGARVASGPIPDFGPAYHVAIHMERFESVRGDGKTNGEAVVDALWTIRGPQGQSVGSGRTLAEEPALGGSIDTLAAAHSRALATLSAEIANALKSAGQ
jgi:uncharacterized lipoprotein YmbA